MSPTLPPSPSHVESGDHKDKCIAWLEGEWGSMVLGGESRDLRGDGSMEVCEW
jgi:hypothetical protein